MAWRDKLRGLVKPMNKKEQTPLVESGNKQPTPLVESGNKQQTRFA
jgi:hypothetical protein